MLLADFSPAYYTVESGFKFTEAHRSQNEFMFAMRYLLTRIWTSKSHTPDERFLKESSKFETKRT